MVLLYTAAIFVSSALVFLIQPVFARLMLPLLGGAPAIWITSILFFQAVLLAGYAYAHWAPERLGHRRHAILHLLLLGGAALTLPLGIPAGWVPDESRPVLWLLVLLVVSLGPQFFVLSASGPLFQRWFSATSHEAARDPYFLYRASNVGSMLALVSYPIAVEPFLALDGQARAWAAGFVALVLLTTGAVIILLRSPSSRAKDPSTEERGAPVSWKRRIRWLMLAFAPSSLMLGVTTYLTADIAAIPLLWLLPLTLYLLTFILVFGRRSLLPTRIALRIQPFFLIPVILLLTLRLTRPPILLLPHLLVVLAVGTVCHGLLADDRPHPRRLTEFYLWIALGGVLGGAFNALIAPLAFKNIVEYPLILVLALLLRPNIRSPNEPKSRRWDALLPLTLFALMMGALVILASAEVDALAAKLIVFSVAALGVYTFADRTRRFALGVAAMLIASSLAPFGDPERVLYASRTFFGAQKVLRDEQSGTYRLVHGTTNHGAQNRSPDLIREPLTYYHKEGPIGDVFEVLGSRFERIGVIGLGTGSLVCYSTPGQGWTFCEIDPEIERIARDRNLFTFLSDCGTDTPVIIGDARLSLRSAHPGTYDLLVVDAFNSDAIPLHLLTREALRIYIDKLAPRGVIAFHLSNRYLDLRPVLARLADDAGLVAKARVDRFVTDDQLKKGKLPSIWIVMARSPENLHGLEESLGWTTPPLDAEVGVWTDDFSNILAIFRW